MRITFLGTGDPGGIPIVTCSCNFCMKSKQRTRASIAINSNGKNLVFDASPDLRQQLIKNGIWNIDSVFITHLHFDHLWGIGEVVARKWLREKVIPVYVNDSLFKTFSENYSWMKLKLKVTKFNKQIKKGKLKITSIKVKHIKYAETSGFVIQERKKKVVYIPDYKGTDEKGFKIAKNADVLIVDGLYLLGKYMKDPDHLGGRELLREILKLDAKKVFVVALSEHFYKKTAKQMRSLLPKNFFIPCDGQKIEL